MRVYDRMTMLVTGDPVAELDAALGFVRRQWRRACHSGDRETAGRLRAWIDQRLDERLAFRDRTQTPTLTNKLGQPSDARRRPPQHR